VRIVSIVGARPQFVKLKPMHEAIVSSGHEHVVVHTGQHYDPSMSEAFFVGLGLPDPSINLEVGSGSHASQTGLIMERLDSHLAALAADWMLIYGDTNSTLAAALVAAKSHTPLAHVEAGLRSRNRRMPEEINRILADHASDLLLAPTREAMRNLAEEGLGVRSHHVGDVMNDLIMGLPPGDRPVDVLTNLDGPEYVVATIHRASNTDDREVLSDIVDALSTLEVSVFLVVHPRLRTAAASAGVSLDKGNIRAIAPLPYSHMVDLVRGSSGVVTDSGGLQKEAFLLEVACTTLREETEWPETLADERNILDPRGKRLRELATRRVSPLQDNPYGDGRAAFHIVRLLEQTTVESGGAS